MDKKPNKAMIIGLTLAFIVMGILGYAYTTVTDKFIDKCHGDINLSQTSMYDSLFVQYDQTLPKLNYSLSFEPTVFDVVYTDGTYNQNIAKVFRNCYADKKTRANTTGYCIYELQFNDAPYRESFSNIRLLKQQVDKTFNINSTIQGDKNTVECQIIGVN